MPKVEHADFCDNGLTPKAAQFLFPSLNKNLKSLDFSINQLGNRGTMILKSNMLGDKTR